MSELFTLQRFLLLVRNEIVNNYRKWLLTSGSIAFGIFITATLFERGNPDFYFNWYLVLINIGGIVMASHAFLELHDKTKNESYLLIPASSLEKTLAKLFIVTVAFISYILIFHTLTSIIVEALLWLLVNRDISIFNPLSTKVWLSLPPYLFAQSFFFLGAAWFKKTHLPKTLLSISLVCFGFFLLGLLLVDILFNTYFENSVDIGDTFNLLFNVYEHRFFWIVKVIAVLIPLVCWFIAWKRVEEAQVSDGI